MGTNFPKTSATGLQPQYKFAGGFVVFEAALDLLGDGVGVLEAALDGVAFEDGAGAADGVGEVDDYHCFPDGVGAREAEVDAVVGGEGEAGGDVGPEGACGGLEVGVGGGPMGFGVADLSLGDRLVLQLDLLLGRFGEGEVDGSVETRSRDAEADGCEPGREEQAARDLIERAGVARGLGFDEGAFGGHVQV